MSVFELFGQVAHAFGSEFALISVIGSIFVLITFITGESDTSFGEKMRYWGIGGLVFGGVCQLCYLLTSQSPELEGAFFRLQFPMVNLLFLVSLGFLVLTYRIRKAVNNPANW